MYSSSMRQNDDKSKYTRQYVLKSRSFVQAKISSLYISLTCMHVLVMVQPTEEVRLDEVVNIRWGYFQDHQLKLIVLNNL